MGWYWNYRNLLDKVSAAQSLNFCELAIAGNGREREADQLPLCIAHFCVPGLPGFC